MAVEAKICGLRSPEAVAAALNHGARMVGFVFFPASPRHVSLDRAAALSRSVGDDVERVGVTVDADDDLLRRAIAAARLSVVQLHGRETPRRVADVRERFGVRTMKVARVSRAEDLDAAAVFEPVADLLMFDAKPPRGATRPGGNAAAFDWRLLAGRTWRRPWLLSGGLDVDNVGRAVELTGARTVDVSSGVESAPGVKDPALVGAFLERVAAL